MTAAWIVFWLSLGAVAAFLSYPLAMRIAAVWLLSPRTAVDDDTPSVTVLLAVRNGAEMLRDKIHNTLTLDYPQERLNLVVVSDGSTDETTAILETEQSPRLKWERLATHRGKDEALNVGLPLCDGEILVFTDLDAKVEPGALRALVGHFRDPLVGGVCGQRLIGTDRADLDQAQSDYITADSYIKRLESQLGSITSNDGKLFAVRRCLCRPIPPGVTDDLYRCLSVVAERFRFVYEPRAVARIRTPSRTASHEVRRRRRIVARSLCGIFKHAELLNPCRYGLFSVGLLTNKVLRRLLPLGLLGLLVSSALLASVSVLALLVLLVLAGAGALAVGYPLLCRGVTAASRPCRLSGAAFYLCVGGLGTLLGVWDYLSGRTVVRWEPQKSG